MVVTDSQILMAKIPIRDAIALVKFLVGPFKNVPLYPAGQPWLRRVLDLSLVANEKSGSNSRSA